jgi:predicted metal-dependent phosphoesterase TrpH
VDIRHSPFIIPIGCKAYLKVCQKKNPVSKSLKEDLISHEKMNHLTNIVLKEPDFSALKRAGFTVTDMHFHTHFSDTFTKPNHILRHAAKLGVNLAITDHNCINGVKQTYNNLLKVNVIPGIEVSCIEGHHILLYFPTYDELEQFYLKHIKGRQCNDPYSNTNISTEALLHAAKHTRCLSVAAHPFAPGYYGIQKNFNRGFVSRELMHKIHAIEAISGAYLRRHNLKAIELVRETEKPFTGGSDGHSLMELGNAIVATKATTTLGIIEEIKARRNMVVGIESQWKHKFANASKMLVKHLPYLKPTIKFKYANLYKKSFKYYGDKLKTKLP